MKNINRKICAIVAVICVFMSLTGCGTSTEIESPILDTTATEPNTEPATEPEMCDFEFGEEVWAIEFEEDGSSAYLVRYAVVNQHGGMVEVVPWFTSDIQDLRDFMGDTYLIGLDLIYRDRYEAMAAVAEANGETLEEYLGQGA